MNTQTKQRMNDALDGHLRAEQRAVLDATLENSPEEAELWGAMQDVDRLLRATPALQAPHDLVARIMAQVASMGAPQARTAQAKRQRGNVLVLTLGMALAVSAGLAVVLILAAQVIDTSLLNDALQQAVPAFGSLASSLEDVLNFIGGALAQYPFLPALLLMVIPLSMLWVWLVTYLSPPADPESRFFGISWRSMMRLG